jgi:flagellar M-ring protein FliF
MRRSPSIEKDEGMPLWRDPEMVSLIKDLIKYGAIAGIIAYLLLGVVRPLLKTMLPPPPEPRARVGSKIDVVDEKRRRTVQEHVPTAAELLEKKLAEARELAQQDPRLVANIIKEWTGANGS